MLSVSGLIWSYSSGCDWPIGMFTEKHRPDYNCLLEKRETSCLIDIPPINISNFEHRKTVILQVPWAGIFIYQNKHLMLCRLVSDGNHKILINEMRIIAFVLLLVSCLKLFCKVVWWRYCFYLPEAIFSAISPDFSLSRQMRKGCPYVYFIVSRGVRRFGTSTSTDFDTTSEEWFISVLHPPGSGCRWSEQRTVRWYCRCRIPCPYLERGWFARLTRGTATDCQRATNISATLC